MMVVVVGVGGCNTLFLSMLSLLQQNSPNDWTSNSEIWDSLAKLMNLV